MTRFNKAAVMSLVGSVLLVGFGILLKEENPSKVVYLAIGLYWLGLILFVPE